MVTVEQAATRLGVSSQEVRRLVRAGTLPATRIGRTLVVDDDAVDGRTRLTLSRGRSPSDKTAWALLWALSGEQVTWLDRSGRSRLTARMQRSTAEQLVAAVRFRAERHELRVLPAYRDQVLAAEGVVSSGMTAAQAVGADIVTMGAADECYCSVETLARLRGQFGLSDRGRANLVVRVPQFDQLPLAGRAHMPAAAVAVDLAESADVRTRRAGLTLLDRYLSAARR